MNNISIPEIEKKLLRLKRTNQMIKDKFNSLSNLKDKLFIESHLGEGMDVTHPGIDLVLLKLYQSDGIDENGLTISDQQISRETQETMAGMILRIGPVAFTDEYLFPNGSPYKIGDWVSVRMSERIRQKVNGHLLLFVQDKRIVGPLLDPSKVKTSFDPIVELTGF